MPACNLSNFDIKKRGAGRSEKRKALFYRNLGICIHRHIKMQYKCCLISSLIINIDISF